MTRDELIADLRRANQRNGELMGELEHWREQANVRDFHEDKLKGALLAAKIPHYTCEDCWYSCPLSEEGCCDKRETECTCGAEKHNAAIDAALTTPDAKVKP